MMGRRNARITVQDVRSLGGEEIQVLRELKAHGLPWSVLSGMSVRGHPVTRAHLKMAEPGAALPEYMAAMPPAPSDRLLRRPAAAIHVPYAASLYDMLDRDWRRSGTVDAYHLLEAWNLFELTLVGITPPGAMPANPSALQGHTAMDLRDLWITVRAMIDNMISLSQCSSCGMPLLTIDGPDKSNWSRLLRPCLCCEWGTTILRRARNAGVVAPITLATSTTPSLVRLGLVGDMPLTGS
ncbi:hypothetical protein [Rhodanobacter denitrificans]|uniref:Uncharacterized protein n=2 Tax=Pseudomonadota TaxID=1224 RepID=M4NN30_9GAMM|nr:hypothetical protein [Rhodanobacter denitrificans]AGG89101.1 hypothetical protein R2APBS1_1978 [Rhodanobacter denitrificans]UJJ52926.1 hypothetical protein LRK52_18655 [Rhodanobacter denitrificans]